MNDPKLEKFRATLYTDSKARARFLERAGLNPVLRRRATTPLPSPDSNGGGQIQATSTSSWKSLNECKTF
jgi:hypothetical protein